ncbi:MAG: IS91 family transposase [Planctomycetota bacterium]
MSARVDLQTVFANFLPEYREHSRLHPRQRQVCAHIAACRTPALGGLTRRCDQCDYEIPRYHACRDRHCPKCQGRASAKWAERQLKRLLPVTYYHLVFTLPDALNPWVQAHPQVLYHQLFKSTWATLKTFAENKRHLGGELGMSAVLHTWGQTLIQHVHLHCLVPGGVLTPSGTWRPAKGEYLFPVRALSRHFRGHFVAALRRRAQQGELSRIAEPKAVDAMLDALMDKEWIIYAKPCLGHTEQVVGYLARYSHRIALSDWRLVAIDEGKVGLRYTDHRDAGARKTTWLDGAELVRRFLLHVLPKGLMRIRHYGLLANRCRATRLREARNALELPENEPEPTDDTEAGAAGCGPKNERCPRCRSGRLLVIATLTPPRLDGG